MTATKINVGDSVTAEITREGRKPFIVAGFVEDGPNGPEVAGWALERNDIKVEITEHKAASQYWETAEIVAVKLDGVPGWSYLNPITRSTKWRVLRRQGNGFHGHDTVSRETVEKLADEGRLHQVQLTIQE